MYYTQGLSFQTKIKRHCRSNSRMYYLVAYVLLVAGCVAIFRWSILLSMLFALLVYVLTGGWKWFGILHRTLLRDMRGLYALMMIEMRTKHMLNRKMIVANILANNAKDYPDKLAYVNAETNEKLTFKEANEFANKIANTFYDKGFQKGDVVALMMENRVEYVPLLLGLSKIGVVTALINTNLLGDSLMHCILVSECKAVIFSDDMQNSLLEIKNHLNKDFFHFGNQRILESAVDLKRLVSSASVVPPVISDVSLTDKMLYIYTSGTTGLPKAALIRGVRYNIYALGVKETNRFSGSDVFYNTLPLYHTNAQTAAAGAALYACSTFVLRRKFSASRFFEDCCNHKCTTFNYIGEICRYLLAQPVRPYDKGHSIRLCFGNGMRTSIWKEFQIRFNIPLISEVYGATEGNANLSNFVGKVGAVGFTSVIAPSFMPVALIKRDNTGEIIRDHNGVAVKAKPGEPGELVAKIRSEVSKQFDGYVNKQATKKKIAFDIFSKGDSAFLSGDILISDEDGFLYFQDRTGDTFRWKGENVSTNEVEGAVSKILGLNDVCVYGVEVPGTEGKAGMACIADPKREVTVPNLFEKISSTLPLYATPVFIRVTNEIAKTGTFKIIKTSLCKEAFNPSHCTSGDSLYYANCKEKIYMPLDRQKYDMIINRELQF